MVKGRVPDLQKRWAVAVTKDAEEFQNALPEFRRLVSEGKWMEARQLLHISTEVNVSTRSEAFVDGEKTGDLPGEVGRFWFSLSTPDYQKYGGYLTFLTYTEDPDFRSVGLGKDIGEATHGEVLIRTAPGEHGYKYGYGMDIVKAKVSLPHVDEK